MPGALDGLKVLDFTTLYPGPLATMLLADLGAEVLRVEAPDRPDLLYYLPPLDDTGVSHLYRTLNRNKRTMTLDLKATGASAVVERLVDRHDIVVEQFRPGVMNRLGIGYEALRAVQPRLIYCAISSYGQTGPLARRPGHDINFLARSGTSWHLGRRGTGPLPLGVLVGDVGGGTWTAVAGILAAVVHRQQCGEGQFVDVSMTDGALLMNAMAATSALAGEDLSAESTTLTGAGAYDYYRTADGRHVAVGAIEPHFFERLIDALGRPDLADAYMAEGDDAVPLKSALAEAFASHSLAHWREVFDDVACCVEPVLRPTEAVDSPLFTERGMVVDVADGAGGTVRQVGNPINLSACPPRYDHSARVPGSDTDTVLAELGLDEATIMELRESGAIR